MIRRHGLVEKLIIFFVILVVSVLTLTGVSAYLSQMSIYREQSERRLQNTLIYLAELMSADGQDFLAFQRLSIALKDEINIPFDFDGDYHDAKTSFYDSFNREYPGKTPGKANVTGPVSVFGLFPNSQPSLPKILVWVFSWAWTSKPITISYLSL